MPYKLWLVIFINFILFFLLNISKKFFQPVAIVVPHHNIVADIRLNYLKQIAARRPQTNTVIIIGPDHFSAFQKGISTTTSDWHLSNGNLSFNQDIFSQIIFPVNQNKSLLKNDHTIYNLLPDIKSIWPDAKIIPMIIGQKYDLPKLDTLITQLNSVCKSDCLLITSVDFSHYLPADLANIHDQKSIRVLNNFEIDQIKDLEVDSPQSLYVLSKFSQLKNASRWQLFTHTNSGGRETTSHLFGSYQPSLLSSPKLDTQTFTYLPHEISRLDNQNSLGDRFFYGTDIFEVKTDNPVNTIISGYTQKGQSYYYNFPLILKDGKYYFFK